MPEEEWRETEVHRHSTYSCSKCGKRFDVPHEFYAHTDDDCRSVLEMRARLGALSHNFDRSGSTTAMVREARTLAGELAVPPPVWAAAPTSGRAQLAELGEDGENE